MSSILNTPTTDTVFTPVKGDFDAVIGSGRPSKTASSAVATDDEALTSSNPIVGSAEPINKASSATTSASMPLIDLRVQTLALKASNQNSDLAAAPNVAAGYYTWQRAPIQVAFIHKYKPMILKIDTSYSWLNTGIEPIELETAEYGYEEDYVDDEDAFADYASSSASTSLSELSLPNPFSPSYVPPAGASPLDQTNFSPYRSPSVASPDEDDFPTRSRDSDFDLDEDEDGFQSVIPVEPVPSRFHPNGSLASLDDILSMFRRPA